MRVHVSLSLYCAAVTASAAAAVEDGGCDGVSSRSSGGGTTVGRQTHAHRANEKGREPWVLETGSGGVAR